MGDGESAGGRVMDRTRHPGGRPSPVAVLREIKVMCDAEDFGDRGRSPSQCEALSLRPFHIRHTQRMKDILKELRLLFGKVSPCLLLNHRQNIDGSLA